VRMNQKQRRCGVVGVLAKNKMETGSHARVDPGDGSQDSTSRTRTTVNLTRGLRLETMRDGNRRLVAAPNQTSKTSKEQTSLAARP
jgi:hypothetical protein